MWGGSPSWGVCASEVPRRGRRAGVTYTGVTPLGSPRALTATGGGCEGSRALRKAAGVWPGPKRAGEAQCEELGSGGGGGGGSGNTSGTGKVAEGLKTGGGGGGGDGEDGPHMASGSTKGGPGTRPKGLGVGDRGDGRLDELGLEVGVASPEAGPRF